jgi:hypothetical protein
MYNNINSFSFFDIHLRSIINCLVTSKERVAVVYSQHQRAGITQTGKPDC